MASVLFPRTITVKRPIGAATKGDVGFQSVNLTQEVEIISGVPANLHMAGLGHNTGFGGGIVGDSPLVGWSITISAGWSKRLPIIMERDIIYDDLGRRFQVSGYEPTVLGTIISCVRLKS